MQARRDGWGPRCGVPSRHVFAPAWLHPMEAYQGRSHGPWGGAISISQLRLPGPWPPAISVTWARRGGAQAPVPSPPPAPVAPAANERWCVAMSVASK